MPGLPPPVTDVILPVLDEREALPWVLGRMPAGYRAIVADNGSRDGSVELARSLDPADLPSVAGPVLAGRADLVLGARQGTRSAWKLRHRVANRALALELRRRSGITVTDLGPMRAASREALLVLGIEDRRFGWPLEMVLLAAQAGWRIDEVGLPYVERTGRSKVTGTVGGYVRTVRDMAAVLR